jgi:hypothetical protein
MISFGKYICPRISLERPLAQAEGDVQWLEGAEREFRSGSNCAPVGVDHLTGAVPSPIGDPSFAPPFR